ncbi:hypothetical protein ACXNSR_21055 [Streptomyces sp. NC-S4]
MTTPGAHGAQGAPGEPDASDALDDWRRDALLLCLLPVFCWPVVVGAVIGRSPASASAAALGLVLGPVLLGSRELRSVRRVRRLVRDPAVRWTAYEAVVVRARWRPPLLALAGGRQLLTLGLLGRRVLPPRPWPRTAAAPATVVVRLAGDPAAGGAALWAPYSGALGHARPARRGRTGRALAGRVVAVRARTRRARPLRSDR